MVAKATRWILSVAFVKSSDDYQKKASGDEWTLSVISIVVLSSSALTGNPLTQQYKSHCYHDTVLCHHA